MGSKTKRPRRRLPDLTGAGASFISTTSSTATERSFRRGRDDLAIGAEPLRAYLERAGMAWVVQLRESIRRLDLSALTSRYSSHGAAPIHPSITLGLIFYGILLRQWSLRELEALALRDVGAWYICGGEQPDHSTIGDFIHLHAATISEPLWFASQTAILVRELKLTSEVVAGDGTVVESFASRFRTLSAEAAQRKADKATAEAAASPSDALLQDKAADATQIAEQANTRAEARADKGRNDEGRVIAPTDPDAVLQPRKDGPVRPGYKPSVLSTPERIIVGCYVDPSSECSAIAPMLWQHRAIFGALPRTLLLDAGYHSIGILCLSIELDLDLLCPSGKTLGVDDWEKNSQSKKFPKRLFVYQPDHDVYRCPQGRELKMAGTVQDREHGPVRVYRATECANCPARERCTDAAHGRTVKRYEGDDLKEAMALTMRQPPARTSYRRRGGIVEPIFAAVQQQGLRRFRRRGIEGARVEFTLHCLAYNLGRTQRLRAAIAALIFASSRREDGTRGRVVLLVLVIIEVTP